MATSALLCPKAALCCSVSTPGGASGSLQPGVWAVLKPGLTEHRGAAKVKEHLIPSPRESYHPNPLIVGWDLNKGHLSFFLKQIPMSKATMS